MGKEARLGVRARCVAASLLLAALPAAGSGRQPEPARPAGSDAAFPVSGPAAIPPIALPTTSPPADPSTVAPPFDSASQPQLPPPPAAPRPPEQRLLLLEQQNAELSRQMQELMNQQQSLLNRLNQTQTPASEAPLNYATPGQLGRPLPVGVDRVGEVSEEELSRARVDLSHGIRLLSPDGKYRIELHALTQPELRIPTATSPSSVGTDGLVSSFDNPRTRFYFTGSVDKYFDFYTVLNRGYGSVDVLDSYMNFKLDKTFNVRVGRTKTPYGYEYYKIAEGDLIGPERSVFVGNLSPNRQYGVMAYGRLLGETIEYAGAVMNGPTRSFQDFNDAKMVALYLNTKPFLYGGTDLVRNLNLGGSVNFQHSNDPLEPISLHTANDETTTAAVNNVSPTFLAFNPAAKEIGRQAFWSGDIAWYYRSLTSLIMYNGGFITYALPTRSGIQVPFEGGSAAFTYFITGEEIVTRKEVEPLRDFDFRHPLSHPGAVELITRVGLLNAGSIATSSGLVDPTLWSRRAMVFDNGVNWYMNRFVRISFDWQHSAFGSRVSLGGGRFENSADMFWLRTQIFY
jgi:phosphate-selective porin OprO and OprP